MVYPGAAADRKLFEKVGKWEVERDLSMSGAHACLAAKIYKDKADDDAENAVVLKRDEGVVIISLGYENWGWDKKEEVEVAFLLDKRMVLKNSKWTGDDTTLYTSFPDRILPDLIGAKKLVLRFSDGDADFDLAGLPDAYDALKRCDAAAAAAADLAKPAPQVAAPPAPTPQVATAPQPAPQAATPAVAAPAPQAAPAVAAAPALPSKERVAVYFVAGMVQEALKTCDIRSTGKQRADLDTKVAAMKAEMGPAEAELRKGMKEALAEKPCPKGEDLAKVERMLQDLIDKSPEEFAAQMDKESAAKEAKAGDKP
ncbi:hypothetical protein MOX02_02740 [Methylobacterium oxalidis]|uniref:Uncharacterized protein n=2 Tax=Methylobacterium oxalidis TaxID=944322 RepID=A0A512IX32_9HYPH|nr:hypothetical protein MOX02_02740 [Methylobacterium oxalidis]GLS62181.1 hypothetical protein GCM10007888_05620 [Methylobacterium oxalidis]